MTVSIDRRQLLATSAFGLGGLMMASGKLTAQTLSTARGFTHGVASGEPASDSVLLWTRYSGSGDSAHVRAEIAESGDFSKIIASNQMITGPWRDWTVKITLDGLQAGRRYFYRFVDARGAASPIGRTKTLPTGRVEAFNICVFSCSNLPFGLFNAYAHAAARDDIDLTMHLGDYIYEYKRGNYPGPTEGMRFEALQPENEILSLADYRLRLASYRADADLQALHAAHPMIVSMDDHESTNDSWEGGAQNHQADEGDWSMRRAAALQAYREWMPVGDEPYAAYEIGSLATLFRTDTRLLARTDPRELGPLLMASDPVAAMATFKSGPWRDPAETMLGTRQESWLARGLKASTRDRTRWQVVGMGTIMGETYMPQEAASWLAPDAPLRNRQYTLGGIAAAKAGLPFNLDNWGGYPAARERFLTSAREADANLIVLSGDSHNAWAYELGKGAGVEFAGHSVTSPGYENATGADPKVIAAGLVKSSPELKWTDTSRRGYMRLSLTPLAATNEWVFMQGIKTRSTATQPSHRMRVQAGRAALQTV